MAYRGHTDFCNCSEYLNTRDILFQAEMTMAMFKGPFYLCVKVDSKGPHEEIFDRLFLIGIFWVEME